MAAMFHPVCPDAPPVSTAARRSRRVEAERAIGAGAREVEVRRWPSMLARWQACVAMTLAACGDKPELAEIRLYPCLVSDMEPAAVRVEIAVLDGEGEMLGAPLSGAYELEPSILADGFATLGYRPRPDAAALDVTVRWYATAPAGPLDQADAVAVFSGLDAPAAGDVVLLGAEACEATSATDGGTSSSGDDTTGSTSSDTTESTSGADTTTTMSTESSSDTSTSTSTSGTSDATGTTGGASMEGMPCDTEGTQFCEPQGSGAGNLLECAVSGVWESLVGVCPEVCAEVFPSSPEFIGCAGDGLDWACLCQAELPDGCTEDDAGCNATTLTLCVDGAIAYANCTTTCQYFTNDDYSCH